MPKDRSYDAQDIESSGEQEQSLLADDENESTNQPSQPIPLSSRRQPSIIVHPPPLGAPRTPRTANRVRFLDERRSSEHAPNGHAHAPNGEEEEWLEEEAYISRGARGERRDVGGQRVPLLTDIEAPSVMVANDLDFNAEDLLESARPKSGMISAFMNMANSIIGAGIIGQPYAFRQAGMTMGIVLLICLTITVDWTIRLIVVNSKLSGSNSFQTTVSYCFGKSGLIAISVAQWAFAFGGMIGNRLFE
ncbi:hypothetical protein MMC28_002981 [Mycoblastus sanguinarius]|nr:hypothetical protein [Mycoblastus sanguinarius]